MKLPALDPQAVPVVRGSGYPEPFKSRMGDRAKQRLGEACGLTKLGVNLVRLGPGGRHVRGLSGGQARRAPLRQPLDAAGTIPGNRQPHRWRHCVLSRRRPDVDRNGGGDGSGAQGWEALLTLSSAKDSIEVLPLELAPHL